MLMRVLPCTTQSDVASDQPWTLTPKWNVPGSGEVDAALGKFRLDESGHLSGEPQVMVELNGAKVDLYRKMPTWNITPVQQIWNYIPTPPNRRGEQTPTERVVQRQIPNPASIDLVPRTVNGRRCSSGRRRMGAAPVAARRASPGMPGRPSALFLACSFEPRIRTPSMPGDTSPAECPAHTRPGGELGRRPRPT